MKIDHQAYEDADNRLTQAKGILESIGQSAIDDPGRHLSNAIWAAATLIEDAQGILDGGSSK